MKRDHEIAVISKGAFARTVRIYAPKKAERAVIIHNAEPAFCKQNIIGLLKSCDKNTALIGIDGSPVGYDCYLPFKPEKEQHGMSDFEPKADTYREYLSAMLIPYLEKRFAFKRYCMLGTGAAAAFALYYAATGDARISDYGIIDAPLQLCPKAFTEFLKTAEFSKTADYYISASRSSGNVFDLDNISCETDAAIAIAAALEKASVHGIELDITSNGTAKSDKPFSLFFDAVKRANRPARS